MMSLDGLVGAPGGTVLAGGCLQELGGQPLAKVGVDEALHDDVGEALDHEGLRLAGGGRNGGTSGGEISGGGGSKHNLGATLLKLGGEDRWSGYRGSSSIGCGTPLVGVHNSIAQAGVNLAAAEVETELA